MLQQTKVMQMGEEDVRPRIGEQGLSELVYPYDTPFVGVIGPLGLPDGSGFGVKQDEIVHVIGLVELKASEVIVHAAIDRTEIEIIYGEDAALVLIPDTVVDLPEPPRSGFQPDESPHVVGLIQLVSWSHFLVDPVKEMRLEGIFLGPSFSVDGALWIETLRKC